MLSAARPVNFGRRRFALVAGVATVAALLLAVGCGTSSDSSESANAPAGMGPAGAASGGHGAPAQDRMSPRAFRGAANSTCRAVSTGPASRNHARALQETIATLAPLPGPTSLRARTERLLRGMSELQRMYAAADSAQAAHAAESKALEQSISVTEQTVARDAASLGLPDCAPAPEAPRRAQR